MIQARIITYPRHAQWQALTEIGPITSGGPAPPLWPEELPATIETLNAIAHELQHETP
jgi:hypothetical protein